MDEIFDRMKSFLSRKLLLGGSGITLAVYVPVLFKREGVSENVTLASLALISIVVGYYFKVNKDSKVLDGSP